MLQRHFELRDSVAKLDDVDSLLFEASLVKIQDSREDDLTTSE